MKKIEVIKCWLEFWLNKKIIDLIILKITDFSKNQLFLSDKIDDKCFVEIKKAFELIKSWFPLEYFLGNANFYWLDFFVDDRVLIPRDDTEVLVELNTSSLAPLLRGDGEKVYIDIWTGSCCIPISIRKNISDNMNKKIKYFALDISDKALEVSKINIWNYNLEWKIELLKSDLLECFFKDTIHLSSLCNREINDVVITANLPYIKDWDFDNMDDETVKYEPDLALYWWKKTGFEMYEKLIGQIFELKDIYKIKNIYLFIEIGFDQKEVAELFLEKNDLKYEILNDNSWIERCINIKF